MALCASASIVTGCMTDKNAPDPVRSAGPSPSDAAPSPSPPPAAPPRTGKVTVSWSHPTHNEDGSTLTNLAGYRVYYGQVPHDWSTRLAIDPASSSVEIGGLSEGTWFFAVTTLNSVGHESDFSAIASTIVGT